MSLLVQAQTSDDDDEITECLQLVLNSSKLGLIHESVNVDYAQSYTRKYLSVFTYYRRSRVIETKC
jgi:meiotically up-regulated gene 157 (Mug157) protein